MFQKTVIFTVVMIFLAACGSSTTPTPETSAQGVSSGGAASATQEPAAALQARLVPVSGRVSVMRKGETEFKETPTATLLGEGDIVRTGADGTALIVFAYNTDTTLSPNSQLGIKTLQKDQNGVFTIYLLQYIGTIFHRANFDSAGSSYEVITPSGVAAIRGTAFYTDVVYAALQGKTPEEIEAWLGSEAFFQTLGFTQDEISKLDGLSVTFDISSGKVTVSYTDGNGDTQAIDLEPGKTVTITPTTQCEMPNDATQSADEVQCEVTIAVAVGVTDRGCGDNICDPYRGENTQTCSADCH
jgi:hypothetical protein